jgi:hypothetical protein
VWSIEYETNPLFLPVTTVVPDNWPTGRFYCWGGSPQRLLFRRLVEYPCQAMSNISGDIRRISLPGDVAYPWDILRISLRICVEYRCRAMSNILGRGCRIYLSICVEYRRTNTSNIRGCSISLRISVDPDQTFISKAGCRAPPGHPRTHRPYSPLVDPTGNRLSTELWFGALMGRGPHGRVVVQNVCQS